MATYDFNVLIEDQSGNALENATVTVKKSDGTTAGTGTTNSSGVLAANINLDTTDNTHNITVSLTGYGSINREYEISYEDTSYFIQLTSYTTNYCTVEDVRKFIGFPSALSPSTSPSDESVADIIKGVEAFIDKETSQSWRETSVTNQFYDIENNSFMNFTRVKLLHRGIRSFDKIEYWTGSEYLDYVASKTEGRSSDYWSDGNNGVLFISAVSEKAKGLRLSYKYGWTEVPEDIKRATVLGTAIEMLTTEDRSDYVPEGFANLNYQGKITEWKVRFYSTIENYKIMHSII